MVYPEHEWLFWMFANVPRGWWGNVKNQRDFVSWLENQLGIETHGNFEISMKFHWLSIEISEDWYKIRTSDVLDHGGFILLKNYYSFSLCKMLQSIHPHFKFRFWKFQHVGSNSWKSKKNQKEYLDWLFEKLQLKDKEDWYSVKENDVIRHGGAGTGTKLLWWYWTVLC